MIRRAVMIGGIFVGVFSLFTPAWAVSSSLWEQNSKDAFNAGEPDGLSIVAPGKIMLAPKAKITNLNARYSWSLAEDSSGRLYAGTGSDGSIFRVDAEGKPAPFADLDLQQIFTLVADKNDILYAGGFPGGKIYSVNPKGEISEYFDTKQASVWALHLDSQGKLFAATGDDGKIFRIDTDGAGEILYDSRERRILSLTSDPEGNVYAGSDQNGIIYKFDRTGKASVFYDTELQEVTVMTNDQKGNIYAVSAPGDLFMKVSPPQNAPIMPKMVEAIGEMMAEGAPSNNGQPSPPLPGVPAIPTAKKRTCFIYQIDKSGAASKFWVSPEQLIFSLAFAGENLLAGSGDEGTIYLISPTGESGIFYKTDQKQVLALHQSSTGVAAGLGNDAAVVRFTGIYSSEGTYYSQVHDATAVSTWGRVFWDADAPPGTRVLVSTRSGNSEHPDDTWSEWTPENGSPEDFVSPSPPARYIQWRAALRTSKPDVTPELRAVTVGYLQNNLPPKVTSITVGGAAAKQKENVPEAASNLAAAMKAMSAMACPPEQGDSAKSKANVEGVKTTPGAHDPKIKIQWQAQDENNGDKLEYTLYFKGTEEQKWKLLKKEITESSHEWNTEAVPDGDYQVKVVASDKISNPSAIALENEKTSEMFTVDNTAPRVKALGAKRIDESQRYRIKSVISDTVSVVSSAHYSVDAGEWIPLLPVDGMFDSPEETVEFESESLERGEHTVAVKAVDYFGNTGSGKIIFNAQ